MKSASAWGRLVSMLFERSSQMLLIASWCDVNTKLQVEVFTGLSVGHLLNETWSIGVIQLIIESKLCLRATIFLWRRFDLIARLFLCFSLGLLRFLSIAIASTILSRFYFFVVSRRFKLERCSATDRSRSHESINYLLNVVQVLQMIKQSFSRITLIALFAVVDWKRARVGYELRAHQTTYYTRNNLF